MVRFTFGVPDLLAGIDFLVIVIGLFGMAELISLVEQQVTGKLKALKIDKEFRDMEGHDECALDHRAVLDHRVLGGRAAGHRRVGCLCRGLRHRKAHQRRKGYVR